MDLQANQSFRARPTLVTLPSEIHQAIVAHLAPSLEELRPGSKNDLKNANLAHRCLRSWVPEVMFRNMALEHVLVGQASSLEQFAASSGAEDLLRHVKCIQVKVPPALRWEIGITSEFATIEERTFQRLCAWFGALDPSGLSDEERRFCAKYHRALVEPFIENRRWYQLLKAARDSWPEIFSKFPNLQAIGAGCCRRVDHPSSTHTRTFLNDVNRNGWDVVTWGMPPFKEDSTINIGWASAVILSTAPRNVETLRLSIANMDNFNSFAAVNQVMNIAYHEVPSFTNPQMSITRLSLTLRGIPGVHGDLTAMGRGGSADAVRYWKQVINGLHDLKTLHLYEDPNSDPNLAFSDGASTDRIANVVLLVLSGVDHPNLQVLRFHDFMFEINALIGLINGDSIMQSPLLSIEFDNVCLVGLYDTIDPVAISEETRTAYRHAQGGGWLDVCNAIINKALGINITLKNPSSCNVRSDVRYSLVTSFVDAMQNLNIRVRLLPDDMDPRIRLGPTVPERFHEVSSP